MISKNEYENAVESKGQFDDPGCGVYKCVIKNAEDFADRQYIKIEYDIVDGKYKGYATDCMERNGFCPLTAFLSYKGKAQGLFKHRIKAIESFNNGYVFDFDEKKLVGKYFVCIMQTEDYMKQNGKVGKRHNCADIVKKEDYDAGNYTIPEHISLQQESASTYQEVADEGDLPF